jgi:lysophospholipase L1-like esterase
MNTCWKRWFSGVISVLVSGGGLAVASEPRVFNLTPELGAYEARRGYGYDLGTAPRPGEPFYFSVRVPEGNWAVTVTLGGPQAGDTTIKAESRRLMLEGLRTAAGERRQESFVVNVRTPALPPPPLNAPGGSQVRLNDREQGALHWDDKLTLEINGSAPAVQEVRIAPASDVVTVYMAGDSTVTDQPFEPAASWGQMLPRFFDARVAVANHAESGETLKSFLTGLRWDKILSTLRSGDYVLIQFGHNDSKAQWPQTYAEAGTTYDAYLRAYLAEVRRRGATPVLLSSVHRRSFASDGRIQNTHGPYLEAVRSVAAEERIAFIDLAAMSATFYEALGPALAPAAFNDGGKDPTHHNNYGAYQLARAVVAGLRATGLPLRNHLIDEANNFHPEAPPLPADFFLPASPRRSNVLPAGN